MASLDQSHLWDVTYEDGKQARRSLVVLTHAGSVQDAITQFQRVAGEVDVTGELNSRDSINLVCGGRHRVIGVTLLRRVWKVPG